MNKKITQRSLAVLLALVMLLPLISIPAFATDASSTLWQQDFESATTEDALSVSYGNVTVGASATDSSNQVVSFALTGIDQGEASYSIIAPLKGIAYYLDPEEGTFDSTYTYPMIKYTSTDAFSHDGKTLQTVRGNVTTNFVMTTGAQYTYCLSECYNASGTSEGAVRKRNLMVTTALADAYAGTGLSNIDGYVGRVNSFASDAQSYDSVTEYVYAFDLYISNDAYGILVSSLDITVDGTAATLQPFQIDMTATTPVLSAGTYVRGGEQTLTRGEWHRLTMVINQDNAHCDVYIGQDFAYEYKLSSVSAGQVELPENAFGVQMSTLTITDDTRSNLPLLSGSVEFDNLAISSSVEGLVNERTSEFWAEDLEGLSSVGDILTSWAKTLCLTEDALNSGNQVLQLDYTPVADNAYYLSNTGNNRYALSNVTVANGVLTGTATISSADYTVVGQVNDESWAAAVTSVTAVSDGSDVTSTYASYYVATGELVDAKRGGTNIAKPSYFIHSAWSNADVEEYVIEMDLYIPVEARGKFATQVQASDTANSSKSFYIQPFIVDSTAGSAVLTINDNQKFTVGGAVEYTPGTWNTVTSVINKTTAVCTIYLNGEFAFACVNKGGTSGSAYTYAPTSGAIDLAANSLMFQVNRGSDVSVYYGYAQVDNVRVLGDAFDLDFATVIEHYDFQTTDQDTKGETTTGGMASAAIQASQTDASNTVLYMSNAGYDDGGYYLYLSQSKTAKINDFELVDDGNGNKLLQSKTGTTVTLNNVTYTINASTINKTVGDGKVAADVTAAEGQTAQTVYVITSAMKDAYCGFTNIANAIYFKNSAWAAADVEEFVISYDIFFSEDAKGIYQTIMHTSTKTYLEPFRIKLDGTVGVLQAGHDNNAMTSGAAKNISLGQWHTITFVINKETSLFSAYVDGEYALSTYAGLTTGAMASFNANGFGMQYRRANGSYDEAGYAGYTELDNITYYTSTKSLKEKYFIETFDTQTGTAGTAMNVGTKVHKGATFEVDPCDPTNMVAKVPMNAAPNTTPILVSIKNNVPASTYYTVTVSGDTVTLDGYTVTANENGTYNITKEGETTATASNLTRTTLQEYYSYYGGDGAVNTNWKVVSEAYSYTTTPVIILSADYYIPSGAKGSFQGQLHSYTSNGTQANWLNLYCIDLGKAKAGPTDNASNAIYDLVQDAWNNISIRFDLVAGKYDLYVNGRYATTVTTGANIAFDAYTWNFAKLPRYQTVLGSDAGYFLVDNVAVYSPDAYSTVKYDAEHLLYVEQNGTKDLLGTELYVSNDVALNPVFFDTYAYRNMLSTEELNSIRLKAESGLRFATEIDLDLLDALVALSENGTFTALEFGTLIAPADYIDSVFTTNALNAAGLTYLEVAATYGAYYTFDQDDATTHFVGSIVNIFAHNVDRDFAGRGYVKLTHVRGNDMTIYSDYTNVDNVKAVATRALNADVTYTDEQLEILNTFAAGNTTGVAYEELYNLDVLAIGDSLFDGHSVAAEQTWLALTAQNFGWNFTNLGWDGWTVAKNDEAYPTGATVRNSMYHWLTNYSSAYCYGGSKASYTYGDVTSVGAEEVDLILLEGGTNDKNWGLPLGDITSDEDLAKGDNYLGALNQMIIKLKEMYPNAKIALVTSWHGLSTSTYTVDGMKSLKDTVYANDDQVILIDAGNPELNGGIDMSDATFRASYACTSSDVNHLNELGMQMMAEAMKSLLWNTLFGGN